MKQPVVVQSLKDVQFDSTVDVYRWIENYFSHIIWDIEKDEWLKMSVEEKYHFCQTILERK